MAASAAPRSDDRGGDDDAIDDDAIDELRQSVGEEAFVRLIGRFLQEAQQSLVDVDAALAAGDTGSLRKFAIRAKVIDGSVYLEEID